MNPVEQSIKRKIEAIGTPLKEWDIKINRGILTGCNDAFIIDEAKKEELITEDPKSAEIIRPILRGRDIKRYAYDWAHLYLIATFPACHYDIEEFPAVKRHLLSFDKERLLAAGYTDIANHSRLLGEYCHQRLEQSGKDVVVKGKKVIIDGKAQKARKKTGNRWFETQDQIGYWEDFNEQKIVYREISTEMEACLLPAGYYITNKCYMITCKNKNILYYLLAFLNSNIFNRIILQSANITGGKGADFLGNVPLIIPNKITIDKINAIQRTKGSTSRIKEYNRLFNSLYGIEENDVAKCLLEE